MPSTTAPKVVVDLVLDDAPEVADDSLLGATMSMLEDVIRSVGQASVPESSGGGPPPVSKDGAVGAIGTVTLALVAGAGVVETGLIGTE